jgi:cyclopropane fatty-acyl-phospholipid synthase-like methyltransferase
MNRDRLSAIAHLGHPVAAPLADSSVDALMDVVAAYHPHTVVDVGCGSAQWLVRLLERVPEARGVGIDLSGEALAAGQTLAEERQMSDRIELRRQDAAAADGDRYDAMLCVGSTHALGGFEPTLRTLHSWGGAGSVAVVGDGFWQRAPDAATLTALDASPDEFPSYAGLVRTVEAQGWAPVRVHVSSLQEWDDYEWSWVSTLRRWARDAPGDPDAADGCAFADQHQRMWLDGYRETLGFAVVVAEWTPR